MKRKPCGRQTKFGVCPYERAPGKQRCQWHVLASSSSDVQAAAARRRREFYLGIHLGPQARVPEAEWPAGERWCAGCQSFVPLWYCSGSQCKACKSMAAHAKRLEKTYGIDAAEYDRLYRLQGGRCAICRNESRSIRFAVDHDHQTGAVRGLLCKRCNHDLLGGGHDSIDLLWRAISYLMFPPAQMYCPPGGTEPLPTDEAVLAALREHLVVRAQATAPRLPEPQEPPF